MHSYQHGAGLMLQFQTVYGIYHSSGDVSNICYDNIMVFWGVMLCSLVDMCQNFRGCYCIHLEVRRNASFFPEYGGSRFLRNMRIYLPN